MFILTIHMDPGILVMGISWDALSSTPGPTLASTPGPTLAWTHRMPLALGHVPLNTPNLALE